VKSSGSLPSAKQAPTGYRTRSTAKKTAVSKESDSPQKTEEVAPKTKIEKKEEDEAPKKLIGRPKKAPASKKTKVEKKHDGPTDDEEEEEEEEEAESAPPSKKAKSESKEVSAKITKIEDAKVLPKLGVATNFAVETKKASEFGTDKHKLQSISYASEICGFHFQRSYVVLICQSKVAFLKADVNREVLLSETFKLGVKEGHVLPGILALKKILDEAKPTMKAIEVPNLSSTEDLPIKLDFDKLDCMVMKRSSIICSYGSDEVLKKVTEKDLYDKQAQALRDITQHANVIRLIGTDVTGNWLMMKPRGELGDIYKCSDPIKKGLPMNEIGTMFCGLLDGLLHIHRCQWIHRDIRPENIIFLRTPKRLMWIDFGLSAKMSEAHSEEFVGFPKFASDEHLEKLNTANASFEWNAETDLQSFAKVFMYFYYLGANTLEKKVDDAYFKYAQYLNNTDDEGRNKRREFLEAWVDIYRSYLRQDSLQTLPTCNETFIRKVILDRYK